MKRLMLLLMVVVSVLGGLLFAELGKTGREHEIELTKSSEQRAAAEERLREQREDLEKAKKTVDDLLKKVRTVNAKIDHVSIGHYVSELKKSGMVSDYRLAIETLKDDLLPTTLTEMQFDLLKRIEDENDLIKGLDKEDAQFLAQMMKSMTENDIPKSATACFHLMNSIDKVIEMLDKNSAEYRNLVGLRDELDKLVKPWTWKNITGWTSAWFGRRISDDWKNRTYMPSWADRSQEQRFKEYGYKNKSWLDLPPKWSHLYSQDEVGDMWQKFYSMWPESQIKSVFSKLLEIWKSYLPETPEKTKLFNALRDDLHYLFEFIPQRPSDWLIDLAKDVNLAEDKVLQEIVFSNLLAAMKDGLIRRYKVLELAEWIINKTKSPSQVADIIFKEYGYEFLVKKILDSKFINAMSKPQFNAFLISIKEDFEARAPAKNVDYKFDFEAFMNSPLDGERKKEIIKKLIKNAATGVEFDRWGPGFTTYHTRRLQMLQALLSSLSQPQPAQQT